MEALIGLDVGTTGVKALAVSPEGAVLARAGAEYPLSTPRPGWAEQDPEEWWSAAERALSELAVRKPLGIGLSGQMHGLVALDRHDRVLRPAILWNDGRSEADCAAIEERLGPERLIELTGNRALPGFTAPKLLWLRREEPAVFERVASVLLPKDLVRLRLTGERATDVSDASGTLLFDVRARAWSEEMLEALELPPAWLPRAYESPTAVGTTAAGVAVAAGAGDQAAAATGVGVVEPGRLSIVLGTSGVVFGVLPGYAADRAARLHVFCHAVPGAWHAMGVMLAAAGSLRWLREATGGASYGTMLAEAEQWPPATEGLLFAPYLAGERTPHADARARGSFVGLTLRHDRGALTRAVLEGVSFGLRDSLALVRELGLEVREARVSGGGARGDLWLRIVASVLGMPLSLTAVEEGSAYGAALLGGVAGGVFPSLEEAAANCVSLGARVEPEPSWATAYAEAYTRFRELYPTLAPLRP